MIEVEGISKSFGPVRALDQVSLQVPAATVCALLGHNGAGKTTLVNILTTLMTPTAGTARVAGLDVVRDAASLRGRIGLTGQFASVDERLSGLRNLMLIARLLGATRREARSRAEELLAGFDLAAAATRPASTYSGGMRRRLDLAASLVGNPDVIFLDEPTTGLDPGARLEMWTIVEQLVRSGTTVLLTTQHLEEAERLADKITVLSRGRVVAAGTSAELKAQVGTRTVTVTLADLASARLAAQAVRSAGLEAHVATEDADPEGAAEEARHVLSVPVERSADLTVVVRALDDKAIEPLELAFAEPSLNDVYLSLSGDEAPGAESPAGGAP
jgi:ABC-2 type transport system ATP-binding protein